MTDYRVLTDPTDLAEAARILAAGEGPLAVDVERASGYRYSQRAYLVQMYREGSGVYLFDPPALGDFRVLQEAVSDVEWIFHAASQDLPSLHEIGLSPDHVFDTELAARLLGHEHVGLGALVEELLGITLAKAHSADDWSTRPLPDSWLEYAALDVLHLPRLREVIAAELAAQGKVELAAQEFAAEVAAPPRPPRVDPWRRLSGLHALHGRRAFAIARSLWEARDDYARSVDTAPGRLLPDRSLVAAVKADPHSRGELAGLRAFTGRASRTQLDRWWQAIESGRRTDDLPPEHVHGDGMPPVRAWAHRNPEADRRLKVAKPAVAAVAEGLGMPVENLLQPRSLRRLAWDGDAAGADAVAQALQALGARPWQVERTAAVIADAFVAATQEAPEPAEAAS